MISLSELTQLFVADGWLNALLQGAVVTLQISAGAFVLGLGIGLLVAMIKLKGPRWMCAWPTCTPRCTARCRSCC